jgi:hypothetical protein
MAVQPICRRTADKSIDFRRCLGNVHDKGVVAITSSSHTAPHVAAHLADLDLDTVFNSERSPYQWFCYDFKDQRVVLTHYSIRTYPYAKYNPRSWVVESSIDGDKWTELDRKVNCEELRATRADRVFPVSSQAECRMVRFRQTGPTHAKDHFLCLTAFEVFGTLREGMPH